jgi:hypothetical protein
MKKFWLNSDNSEVDFLSRHIIKPIRIVWSDEGSGKIKNIECLLNDKKSSCFINCSKTNPPALVMDFGQELNGGISIEFANSDPSFMIKTRIRFGESVSEVMTNPNNDHCIHDVTLDMSVLGKHEFGNTGFRFVRFDFIDCDIEVKLISIKAIALERQLEYKGSFDCSDPLLNKIWLTGARTVHLCCQEYIYDGIKRDRMVWMGDMHPQVHVIAAVFGNIDIVQKSLDFIFDNTEESGWVNNHSSYSIWWIITVWEWYFLTGDKKWLQTKRKSIERMVEQLIKHIDESGRERLGGTRFIDWSIGFDTYIVDQGLQALTVYGIENAKKLFDEVGDNENSNKCKKALELLAKAKINCVDNKQVNAIRVLSGMSDAQDVNKNCLSVKPFNGISTWYAYYVLKARAMAGDFQGCFEFIRRFWGSMLDLGATTFWEHFDLGWLKNASRIDEIVQSGKVDTHACRGEYCYKGIRHSLCHGWAGGVSAWMSNYILGIRPTKPGFKQIKIVPNLLDLEYARGTFPTPYGEITVEHQKKKNGEIETKYNVPPQVEVIQ